MGLKTDHTSTYLLPRQEREPRFSVEIAVKRYRSIVHDLGSGAPVMKEEGSRGMLFEWSASLSLEYVICSKKSPGERTSGLLMEIRHWSSAHEGGHFPRKAVVTLVYYHVLRQPLFLGSKFCLTKKVSLFLEV